MIKFIKVYYNLTTQGKNLNIIQICSNAVVKFNEIVNKLVKEATIIEKNYQIIMPTSYKELNCKF